MTWWLVGVLPNLSIDLPFECGPIAIVSQTDERVEKLCFDNSDIAKFLYNFRDEFGRKRRVSVIMRDAKLRDRFSSEEICAFRDTVAMCFVLMGRAKILAWKNSAKFAWTDFFSIYPWIPTQGGKFLYSSTPALHGIDDVDKFCGTVFPGLHSDVGSDMDFDWPLYNALIAEWRLYSENSTIKHDRIALFRSLNMAFAAGRMPAGLEITLYDVGRSVALWVSAFEILVHTGTTLSNFRTVVSRLKSINWMHGSFSEKSFPMKVNGAQRYVEFIEFLLKMIYNKRNDFIHGNHIDDRALCIGLNRTLLHSLCPIIYRMLLSSHLGIACDEWVSTIPHWEQERTVRGMVYEHALLSPFESESNDE